MADVLTPSLQEKMGAAIGRIPSGVFVVTSIANGQKVGLMASWIAQAGFEPPRLSVAISPEREVYKAIQQSKGFAVNVLSNANMNLMKAFARYSPDQFDGLDIQETAQGITLNEAVAVIHCELKDIYEGGDHHIFVGEIKDGSILNADIEPMVHLRKSGFNY